MNSNQPNHSYSPSTSSFQAKFDSIIDALEREGVTFNPSIMDYMKNLLYDKFAPEKLSPRTPSQNTPAPRDPRLKDLQDQGVDISQYTNDELQMMIEMQPTKEEREEVWVDQLIEGDSNQEDDEESEEELREKLTKRLRYSTFIVGGGAWQNHWEKKKKPGIAARMDEISEYDEILNKPLEPSHDDLKASIQPELLKRFSTQIIVMKPMTKRDYIELIPKFAAVLPPACRGLFRKLATEQAGQAHEDMIGMRFYEEILTQTLTADVAPALSDLKNPVSNKGKI